MPMNYMGMNNSFYLYNDSIFTSHKRYRDDYYNFSPNLSLGGLKPLTPMFANTPINIPGYFMFNNTNPGSSSNTGTPKLKSDTYKSETYKSEAYKSEAYKSEAYKSEAYKSEAFECSTIKSDSHNNSITEEKPKIDCSNIVLVPSAGNNLGFYTWVINGSPHPNVNNIAIPNLDTKKIKIKKKKYKDESD
jgi:hypothetical protein